jgi:APA family basic amino acid/polyamine antiporter
MDSAAVTGARSEPTAQPVHPELFTRQSSGLVREIGLRDALGLNMTIVFPINFLIFFPAAVGAFPHADLVVPIIAAGVFSLLIALIYGQLVGAIPRSGGDYVFLSRIAHPGLGSLAGGAMAVAFLLGGGFAALIWSQLYLPFGLQALGQSLGIHGLTTFAGTVAGKNASFISAIILLIVAAAITALGVRIATRVVFYLFALGAVALLIILGYYTFTSHSAFVGAFNHAASVPHGYTAVQAAAAKAHFTPRLTIHDVWLTTPFLFLAYVGFNLAAYPGGEVKRAGRTVLWANVVALGISVVLCLLLWLALRHLVGIDFFRDSSFLSTSDPSTYSHLVPFAPQGGPYALLITKDVVSKFIYGVAFPGAALAQAIAYILILSRLMFGMSFDRVFPTKLADVSDRTHSPLVAITVATLGMAAFVYLGTYTSGLTTFFQNGIIMFEGVFVLSSVVAMLFPYLRRDLYGASPKLFGASWFGLPPITVIGALSFICMSVELGITVSHKPLSGGFTTQSIIVLAVTFTFGIVAYTVSRLFFRARGIDLRLAMKELPPE